MAVYDTYFVFDTTYSVSVCVNPLLVGCVVRSGKGFVSGSDIKTGQCCSYSVLLPHILGPNARRTAKLDGSILGTRPPSLDCQVSAKGWGTICHGRATIKRTWIPPCMNGRTENWAIFVLERFSRQVDRDTGLPAIQANKFHPKDTGSRPCT